MKTRLFFAVLAIGILVVPGKGVAQNFPIQIFERYLEPLAQQIGMPGLSALIIRNNNLEWSRGYGYADVENKTPATIDTPFPIGGVTQAITGVLTGICVDRFQLEVDQPMQSFVPAYPHPASVRQVLAHASEGRFRYDAAAYAALTAVIEKCSQRPYRVATVVEILDRLSMIKSVPGLDLATPDGAPARALFDPSEVQRYQALLREVAVPYRLLRGGGFSRSEYPAYGMDAAGGLVATARDLFYFERELDDRDDNIPLSASTLDKMWSQQVFDLGNQQTLTTPTGLGWFVQYPSGVKLVWTFGHIPNASSALIVKMPHKRLTLILLSNSDALTAGYNFEQGDVMTSPFVKLFLKLFI
ncbi:MAG TPA: serine hydrolase domain-containing protein [Vicinamibacterales bacterium]|nr:serine hydrolase domain-containing protein [Vicinamibacterales bacterium]